MHTHTHILFAHYLSNIVSALWILCLLIFRCVWRTLVGLYWQPGEGEIHHESNPRQLPPWLQLQPHPLPVVSNRVTLDEAARSTCLSGHQIVSLTLKAYEETEIDTENLVKIFLTCSWYLILATVLTTFSDLVPKFWLISYFKCKLSVV